MSESKKAYPCPLCHTGKVSWHDTHRSNGTDMGSGKPYVMCEDQEGCGFMVGMAKVAGLRRAWKRLVD